MIEYQTLNTNTDGDLWRQVWRIYLPFCARRSICPWHVMSGAAFSFPDHLDTPQASARFLIENEVEQKLRQCLSNKILNILCKSLPCVHFPQENIEKTPYRKLKFFANNTYHIWTQPGFLSKYHLALFVHAVNFSRQSAMILRLIFFTRLIF